MTDRIHKKIDELIHQIDEFRLEPGFTKEVNRRNVNEVVNNLHDEQFLEIAVELIAYSQSAKSSKVREVLDNGDLPRMFANYDAKKISVMNPCDLADDNWMRIKGIRQKHKLFQIVMLARNIDRGFNMQNLLKQAQIPKTLENKKDVKNFWIGFKKLRKSIKMQNPPFLGELTSLLHFLLMIGYDCAKPDVIVMKAAKSIGIVDNKGNDNDTKKIAVIRAMQEYAVKNSIRTSIIDFYFLVWNGQSEASNLVKPEFYKITKK